MKFISGKLVIIAILTLAFSAAGASWWFRYAATHRTATHWGPNASRLIRDASFVELLHFEGTQDEFQMEELRRFLDAPTNRRDISKLPGLTHLRYALLEDRSYIWPPQPATTHDQWQWILIFRDGRREGRMILIFSPDWQFVTTHGLSDKKAGGPVFTRYEVSSPMVLSCKPIADGLGQMLGDLEHAPPVSR